MAKKQEYNGYFLPFFQPVPMNFDMLFRHYFDFITRNVFQIFKFEHLPETVDETFLKYCIFCNGKATFFRLDSGEIVALNGIYSDEPDLYYVPKKMLVSNPSLKKSYLLERDKDCVVVYCSETDIYNTQIGRYGGLYPLICRTATMLADSDLSINVSQKNKRLINVLAAEDQGTKDSIDIVIKKQYAGEPYAVVMKSLIDNVQSVPITDKSGNQDILQLIKAHQYILAHFYEALGLQTHDNMKQERLITAEVNDNDSLAKLNINDMLCTIQYGLDKVNAMFGEDIQVTLNPLLLETPDTEPEEQQSDIEPEEQQPDAEPEEQQSDTEPEEQQPDAEPEEQQSDTEPEEQQFDPEPEEQQSDPEQETNIEVTVTAEENAVVGITINTGGDNDDNPRVQDLGDNSSNDS